VPISGLQQQGSAVGTPLALIELGHDRLAKNSWEQQTLCCAIVRHSEASFVAANTVSDNMFVTEEAFVVFKYMNNPASCKLL
jgi:hypothetical protein